MRIRAWHEVLLIVAGWIFAIYVIALFWRWAELIIYGFSQKSIVDDVVAGYLAAKMVSWAIRNGGEESEAG